MKIVHSNLTGKLSLEDHVFNDAMETAALYCEEVAHSMFAMNGDGDEWVWPCGRRFERAAEEFRKTKRGQ